MTGGIIGRVGLGLDDPAGRAMAIAFDDEHLAEEFSSDDRCVADEPGGSDRRQVDNRS